VQELGQGMILAVYQLNLLSCTASGPRDCRQTAQKTSSPRVYAPHCGLVPFPDYDLGTRPWR